MSIKLKTLYEKNSRNLSSVGKTCSEDRNSNDFKVSQTDINYLIEDYSPRLR